MIENETIRNICNLHLAFQSAIGPQQEEFRAQIENTVKGWSDEERYACILKRMAAMNEDAARSLDSVLSKVYGDNTKGKINHIAGHQDVSNSFSPSAGLQPLLAGYDSGLDVQNPPEI